MDIDLKNIINIYPAVVVRYGDETTTISLEWFKENSQEVERVGYALIFIDKNQTKKEITFESYEEMVEAMREIISLKK